MKPKKLAVLLLLLLCVLVAPPMTGGETAPAIPSVLRVDPSFRPFPVWVEAGSVLDQKNKVNSKLFWSRTVHQIEALLATQPRNGCIRAENYYVSYIDAPQRTDVASATRSASIVLIGKVTAKAFGFQASTPGQLLRIESPEYLKGSLPAEDAYFVFVPVGDFRVGSHRICKTDTRYALPPELGDEVVLFVQSVRDFSRGYIDVLDEGGIVTVRAGEQVELPRQYRESIKKSGATVPDRATLLVHVRSAAKGAR